MDRNHIVSIIVPIYNAEDSLHNCIESILDQTYKNIEIILINDGSTDLSRDICDHYVKSDQRIKVIHQKNKGPSSARNKGIDDATGDYIQFVDADDYIKPMMTEKLVKAMTKNTQLVISGYQSIYFSELKKYIPSMTGIYQNSDFMSYIGRLYKDILLPSPCNKLYDATLINALHLRFIENVKVGEDLLFNLTYIKVCPMIHIIAEPLYSYMIHDEYSLSRSFNKHFFENQHMLHEQVKAFLRENDHYAGENKYLLNTIYATSIMNSLNNLFHKNSVLTETEKKDQIRKIIANIDLEQDANFNESPQGKIIGQMIKNKSIQHIYLFFKIKRILQMKMSPVFHWLKRNFSH